MARRNDVCLHPLANILIMAMRTGQVHSAHALHKKFRACLEFFLPFIFVLVGGSKQDRLIFALLMQKGTQGEHIGVFKILVGLRSSFRALNNLIFEIDQFFQTGRPFRKLTCEGLVFF